MGLFGFGNRYKKLKRADIVDAIVKLQQEEDSLEEKILSSSSEVKALTERGIAEKDPDLRLFLAKKINRIKEEKQADIKRATYIAYNIKMLGRLKDALDDKEFFNISADVPLNKLLADQKGLARFLNKALGTRVKAESVLTEADDTFGEIMDAYEENERIYGVAQSDDELLSVFETADMLDVGQDKSASESENTEKPSQEGQTDK